MKIELSPFVTVHIKVPDDCSFEQFQGFFNILKKLQSVTPTNTRQNNNTPAIRSYTKRTNEERQEREEYIVEHWETKSAKHFASRFNTTTANIYTIMSDIRKQGKIGYKLNRRNRKSVNHKRKNK